MEGLMPPTTVFGWAGSQPSETLRFARSCFGDNVGRPSLRPNRSGPAAAPALIARNVVGEDAVTGQPGHAAAGSATCAAGGRYVGPVHVQCRINADGLFDRIAVDLDDGKYHARIEKGSRDRKGAVTVGSSSRSCREEYQGRAHG